MVWAAAAVCCYYATAAVAVGAGVAVAVLVVAVVAIFFFQDGRVTLSGVKQPGAIPQKVLQEDGTT